MCIVTGHCIECIKPNYLSPADDNDVVPHILQLPFLQLCVVGPCWVSIFFLLSGYMCTIKLLRLLRDVKPDEARRVVASSAFRRTPRLMIPASAITIFSWILTQVGAFAVAQKAESDWIKRTTPPRVSGFIASVASLVRNLVNVPASSRTYYSSSIHGQLPIMSMKKSCGPLGGNFRVPFSYISD